MVFIILFVLTRVFFLDGNYQIFKTNTGLPSKAFFIWSFIWTSNLLSALVSLLQSLPLKITYPSVNAYGCRSTDFKAEIFNAAHFEQGMKWCHSAWMPNCNPQGLWFCGFPSLYKWHINDCRFWRRTMTAQHARRSGYHVKWAFWVPWQKNWWLWCHFL